MNKKRCALWVSLAFAASSLISGCQLLTGYQKIEEAGSAKAWAGDIQPIAGEVTIACIGTYHCEITRIDDVPVIAADHHEPANPAMLVKVTEARLSTRASIKQYMTPLMHKDEIKIVPLSASGIKGLTNYYARVTTAKREVQVNFYPENNLDYVERFAMIHDFVEAGTYQLRAYQKKPATRSGSLLDRASPEPLCVELYRGDAVERRFCKPLNSEQQGEFVEVGLIKAPPPDFNIVNSK